jgi:undecaprenyl-diphosphatase
MITADFEIVRAAQTAADHAVLLLASGIALMGLALIAILAAAHLARRHPNVLFERVQRILRVLRRLPLVGAALAGARVLLPTRYMAVHLVLGLVATAAVSSFIIIAEEVAAGRTVAAFDVAFATALQDRASPHWRGLFRIVTWFGSTELLLVLSTLIAVVLLRRRRHVLATGWIVGQAGGALLMITLKNVFERTRPAAAQMFAVTGWSFPSGHAMSTFVFCGLGAYFLLRSGRSWTTIAIVTTVALTWCVVMGFTRLYLGVHYVSDVVAGLIAATAWVAVCVSATEVALRRTKSRHQT